MTLVTTKPTVNTLSIVGATTNWASPLNAYDSTVNDTTTASTQLCNSGTPLGSKSSTIVTKTFPTMGAQTWTSKTLKVNLAVTTFTDPAANGPYCLIEYSINNGTSFTIAQTFNAVAGLATYSIPLSAAQDETLVQVRVSNTAIGDGVSGSSVGASLYDVWIEGIYGAAGAGKKAAGASAS